MIELNPILFHTICIEAEAQNLVESSNYKTPQNIVTYATARLGEVIGDLHALPPRVASPRLGGYYSGLTTATDSAKTIYELIRDYGINEDQFDPNRKLPNTVARAKEMFLRRDQIKDDVRGTLGTSLDVVARALISVNLSNTLYRELDDLTTQGLLYAGILGKYVCIPRQMEVGIEAYEKFLPVPNPNPRFPKGQVEAFLERVIRKA